MNRSQAIERLREVLRRKHLALSTEETYCGWLARFMHSIRKSPPGITSEQKIERFLTGLARHGVSASTQNQAFNALLFFYTQVLGQDLGKIQSLRAKRPQQIRVAPSVEDVRAVLAKVEDVHGYPTRLVVKLLYGCGLRVNEPLNLRVKDVLLGESKLFIRGAKGGKDRVVPLPCSLVTEIKQQLRAARVVWESDATSKKPVPLPGRLAIKYPRTPFVWQWAWLFPAHKTCRHPRTGEIVRWRLHEANVQRAVKQAAARLGLLLTPHLLRHAYATHCLRRGVNPRDLQDALGHSQLNTTMTYLTAVSCAVASPLDMINA